MAEPVWTDRLSLLGPGALPVGFTHLPHANPEAPKACTRRAPFDTPFDTLNSFVLTGRPFINAMTDLGGTTTVQSLLEGNPAEPGTGYASLAEAVRLDETNSTVEFRLDPRARFQDGRPITAEDVAFTWQQLGKHGRPYYLVLMRDLRIEVLGPRLLRVTLPPGQARRTALELAGLAVLPRHIWESRRFDAPLLEALPASGPYRIGAIEPGRRIVLERDPDWWARDLPINRGRYNFDRVIYARFADAGARFEALTASLIDEADEPDTLRWRDSANLTAFREGRLRRHHLRPWYAAPTGGVTFNLRRPAFADPKVRAALAELFDFAWIDRAITRGEAARNRGIFGNTAFAAEGPPDEAERRLLEPFRDTLPPGFWDGPYQSPPGAGTGRNRPGRETALALLAEAGWHLRDGAMTNAAGEPLRFTVLAQSGAMLKIFGHWFANLQRIGIDARLQVLDPASFQKRRDTRDFDALSLTLIASSWPGAEQRRAWGSSAINGPLGNTAGLEDPAIDAVVQAIGAAPDQETLAPALRALDRLVAWRQPWVPGTYESMRRMYLSPVIAMPPEQPRYSHGRDAWFCGTAG